MAASASASASASSTTSYASLIQHQFERENPGLIRLPEEDVMVKSEYEDGKMIPVFSIGEYIKYSNNFKYIRGKHSIISDHRPFMVVGPTSIQYPSNLSIRVENPRSGSKVYKFNESGELITVDGERVDSGVLNSLVTDLRNSKIENDIVFVDEYQSPDTPHYMKTTLVSPGNGNFYLKRNPDDYSSSSAKEFILTSEYPQEFEIVYKVSRHLGNARRTRQKTPSKNKRKQRKQRRNTTRKKKQRRHH